MKIIKSLIFTFSIISVLFTFKTTFANSFTLYLYFDGNNIRFDNKIQNPAEYIVEKGVDRYRQEISDDKYKIQIISNNIVTYSQSINIPDRPSPFQVSIPDINIADKIQVVSKSQIIDELDVSQYKSCNQNNICEYEKGEDANTCISDCLGDNVNFSAETIKTLQQQNGVIRDDAGTVLLSNTPTNTTNNNNNTEPTSNSSNIILLIGGIIFLVAGIGVFFWKSLKR
jgi:hypothetical protein